MWVRWQQTVALQRPTTAVDTAVVHSSLRGIPQAMPTGRAQYTPGIAGDFKNAVSWSGLDRDLFFVASAAVVRSHVTAGGNRVITELSHPVLGGRFRLAYTLISIEVQRQQQQQPRTVTRTVKCVVHSVSG